MTPQQFIIRYGILEAELAIKAASNALVDCGDGTTFHVNDLYNLLKSVDLILEHYTVERAKIYANSPYTAPEVKEQLEKAIKDHESIYGGGE